ncbi:MAG: hypothetical protein PWP04_1686 [Candidatus Atribacteria bacterium]|nr:hypothetical protein [Candidatus Atribacteria bacterium]
MGIVSLQSLVKKVEDLPALPAVVRQVMELTEDPNSTARDINEVLNKDQSMTAKVLRLANSAFYGFPRRIPTVTDATIMLGFQTIRSIVMAASVSNLLSQEVEGYALLPGELWKHSQSAAISARLISREVKFPKLELAYTAALLHDIGKVILNSYLQEVYQEVMEKVEEENLSFLQAEEEILGFNHALVGSKVAEKWNLPHELVEAIAFHHSPELAKDNPKLTAIVHVSDFVCVTMGVGVGTDGFLYPISPQAMGLLGLEEGDIHRIIAQLSDLLVDQDSF